MLCSDTTELLADELEMLAKKLKNQLCQIIRVALCSVVAQNPNIEPKFWICGEGQWLGIDVVRDAFGKDAIQDVDSQLTTVQSICGPAFAIAMLAKEMDSTK